MPDADSQGRNIPIPDPSLLTTEQLRRELGALREVIETRLSGMDRATELIAGELERLTHEYSSRLDHQREDRDREMLALREALMLMIKSVEAVMIEKFDAIDGRFRERDTRTEQEKLESRISLDAALAAAKEAVGAQNESNTLAINKSDASTKEKIDSLVVQISTSIESLNDKIIALSSRIDRSEGKSQGGAAIWAGVIAVVVVVVAVMGLIVNATR